MAYLNVFVSLVADGHIEKKDGGTYSGYVLRYRTSKGEIYKKNFHELALKEPLKGKLQALKPGDGFYMVEETKGNFKVLTDIKLASEGDDAPAPRHDANPRALDQPAGAARPRIDNSTGMRVGNALNIGLELLKLSLEHDRQIPAEELLAYARGVLQVGDQLHAFLNEEA